MNRLNDRWIQSYKQMTQKEFKAGLPYKNNWLGAWRLMKNCQNTDVCNKPTWICLECGDVTWKNTEEEIDGRGCPHCGSKNIEVKT